MKLVDIGANLSHESFSHDLEAVIASARAAGLAHIIVTGTDKQSNEAALQLSKENPEIFSCSAGFHPHVADSVDEQALDSVRKLVKLEQVVAVGETGLDFNRNFSSRDSQLRVFEQHLQLAAEIGKPLFLHQRDAHPEFVTLLGRYRDQIVGGVVHCFTDNRKALEDYLALDMYIGITGWICDERRGIELQKLLSLIPADRLLLETDAPYLLPRTLSPRPKTRRNEPKYLLEVLKTVAACSGRSCEQIAQQTSENAVRLFKLAV
ncbi:MAG: TatD family hydrolase [Pseudohongiellaceae bacterium]